MHRNPDIIRSGFEENYDPAHHFTRLHHNNRTPAFTETKLTERIRAHAGIGYMKRGRPATRGVDNAIRIARRRGCVMRVQFSPDSICDFFIRTVAFVIFVRIVRFENIVAPVPEIEHECREIISLLRLFPQSQQIHRELWIYTRHGTYRFFRLTAAGIEEIQQSGEPGTATPDETPARAAEVSSIPNEGVAAGGGGTPT
jgi:hypothetical protein